MAELKPPEDFPFPFSPYSIQHDFMTSLYTALEGRKLGIFESPTGTGKSLSLICGALTWLQDHENRELETLKSKLTELNAVLSQSSSDTQSDPFGWLNEQAEQVQAQQSKAETQKTLEAVCKRNDRLDKIKRASKDRKSKQHARQEKAKPQFGKEKDSENEKLVVKESLDDDDEMLLDEEPLLCPEDKSDDEEELSDGEQFSGTKIYFCSRTHSQLAQFVGEVQKSPFGGQTRLVPLASRQNYCINDAVQKLKNMTLINERCLDLQRSKSSKTTSKTDNGEVTKKARKTASSSSCPAMVRNPIEELSEDIISKVQDIEQIVDAGQKLKACPYYASRGAVPDAQVVVLPYNTLLHKATRDACGIRIKDNVVIIDEAHNLLDAIGHIHSSQVSGQHLAHAHSQLIQYRDRYQSRFHPKTLLHLNQVIFIVGKLIRVLGGKAGCDPNEAITKVMESKMFTLPDFAITAEIDNLNLFKILDFCNKSKISHKLHGFCERYEPKVKVHEPVVKTEGIRAFLKEMANIEKGGPISNTDESKDTSKVDGSSERGNNPFLTVLAFLETLTNDCSDGRILLKREQTVGKGYLKFLLLNPAAHFKDIVHDARAVIVAGGTMQPISEFRDQLFITAGGNENRIAHFSCGHIIPAENILPIALGVGPTGKSFDFSYTQRSSTVIISELGRLLVNACNVVPAGIVCFFPSYDYEKYVLEAFEKAGIIGQIQVKKKVFREPKRAAEVENVLSAYKTCIQRASQKTDTKVTGALLFSVIGGKLSEGLNFSDDLGRCVIVVGLPFPNIKSVELQEQMKYLDINVGSGAGQSHYENLCMKAVNQSIGRAVRHKDDYASVLLLDQRYLQLPRQRALPNWILRSLQAYDRFGPAFGALCKFFQAKKKQC